jgi:hypothetical protein
MVEERAKEQASHSTTFLVSARLVLLTVLS